MKKSVLKELVLPSFWLFFFIVSPKNDDPKQLKKEDDTELKKQGDQFSSEDNTAKEVRFTKAVYLSGY